MLQSIVILVLVILCIRLHSKLSKVEEKLEDLIESIDRSRKAMRR